MGCHLFLCAGRRDDLWSWLYVLVEMMTGTLPWRFEEGVARDAAVGREAVRTFPVTACSTLERHIM